LTESGLFFRIASRRLSLFQIVLLNEPFRIGAAVPSLSFPRSRLFQRLRVPCRLDRPASRAAQAKCKGAAIGFLRRGPCGIPQGPRRFLETEQCYSQPLMRGGAVRIHLDPLARSAYASSQCLRRSLMAPCRPGRESGNSFPLGILVELFRQSSRLLKHGFRSVVSLRKRPRRRSRDRPRDRSENRPPRIEQQPSRCMLRPSSCILASVTAVGASLGTSAWRHQETRGRRHVAIGESLDRLFDFRIRLVR